MAKQPATDLSQALDEAAGGRAIVRHGRKRLAIVPAEDLDLLRSSRTGSSGNWRKRPLRSSASPARPPSPGKRSSEARD